MYWYYIIGNSSVHELGVINVPPQLLLDSKPYNNSDNQWLYPVLGILIIMLVCFCTVSLRLLHKPSSLVSTPKPLTIQQRRSASEHRRRKPLTTSIVSSDSHTPQTTMDNKFLSDLLCDSPFLKVNIAK